MPFQIFDHHHTVRSRGIQACGEKPARYFSEVMEYLGMTSAEFDQLCEKFRSSHLWTKDSGEWKLRHIVQNPA